MISEGYTAKQAAEYAGCSTFSIQQWKAAAKSDKMKTAVKETAEETEVAEPTVKSVKKAKKAKRRRRNGKTKAVVVAVSVEKPSISFDEFVQDYWSEHPEAADVLRLPPDLMPKAVEYVNNVLRYTYDRFCEQ